MQSAFFGTRAVKTKGKIDRRLLISLVSYKVAFFLFIFLSIYLLPAFDIVQYQAVAHWPVAQPQLWTRYFSTSDSAYYLKLSVLGYEKGTPSCAFYPLWPLLIRLFTYIAPGQHVLVGLILANCLSLLGIYVLYRFVARQHGEMTALKSAVLLLAFPGAIFLSLIYTEALFLLLISLFFTCLFRQRFLWAAIWGYMLPMTRAIGILVVVPTFWHLIQIQGITATAESKGYSETWCHRLSAAFRGWGMLPVLSIAMGYGTYLTFMYCTTGNPFEGFAAQKHFLNQPSIMNIFNLRGFLAAFANSNIGSLHEKLDSFLDRGFFLLFLTMLPTIWRINKAYFFYALASGLIPAMSNWFFSYSRFLILCFPVFIALAERLRIDCHLFWYIVAIIGEIQIVFLIRHINGYWAG